MGFVFTIILQETAMIVLYVCVVQFKENWHDRRVTAHSAKS